MQTEIVMIGTELLLGQIVDTNASFIGQVLAENGINLFQKTTVGDNRERIVRVLDEALERADVVLTSGGLGPTVDDITRECIAEVTGNPLEYRQELYDQIAARFASFRRGMTENNKRQAEAPRGAVAITNPNGTAPGLIAECDRGVIIAMPGVPKELKAMLTDSVLPYIREKFGLSGLLHYRVLKVCGIGESRVDDAIGDIIEASENPKIGLLASPEAVRVRISARTESLEEANALIAETERRVRERLPGMIMGVDDDTLETVLDRIFTERGWGLAFAETQTGGMMAQRFTASAASCFRGGVVAAPGRFNGAELAPAARVWAEETRQDLGAEAALAVVADTRSDSGEAAVAFVSPNGLMEWTTTFSKPGVFTQLRSTVLCLEHLRRRLLDVEV